MRVDIQFYSHSTSSQVCKHQPPVVQEMVRDTCWLLLPSCSTSCVYGQKSPESSYRLVNTFCEQCIGWLVGDSSALAGWLVTAVPHLTMAGQAMLLLHQLCKVETDQHSH